MESPNAPSHGVWGPASHSSVFSQAFIAKLRLKADALVHSLVLSAWP